jgi:serine/threonine-protein kinase
VLEYVDGPSLAGLLRARGRLAPQAAAHVAAEVCRALDAVHRGDWIHLDVKPANILLGPDGRIKLTDFGIAVETTSAGGALQEAVSGSLPYMAPEQAAGELLSPRSDLYSLGAVYFEMLTGRPPFRRRSFFEYLEAHRSAPVPHPSTLNPSVPRAVGDVAVRALAKRSWDRYPDAGALLADLEAVLCSRQPVAVGRMACP